MVTKVSSTLDATCRSSDHLIQSGLQSWRRLGDVIASAFALGYHENCQSKVDVPAFLVDLRRAAFARLYSADKNVAIFLGRPPRMSKRFCLFQIPSSVPDSINLPQTSMSGDESWSSDARISYRAETRWSALCASLKEDILELRMKRDPSHVVSKTRFDLMLSCTKTTPNS